MFLSPTHTPLLLCRHRVRDVQALLPGLPAAARPARQRPLRLHGARQLLQQRLGGGRLAETEEEEEEEEEEAERGAAHPGPRTLRHGLRAEQARRSRWRWRWRWRGTARVRVLDPQQGLSPGHPHARGEPGLPAGGVAVVAGRRRRRRRRKRADAYGCHG